MSIRVWRNRGSTAEFTVGSARDRLGSYCCVCINCSSKQGGTDVFWARDRHGIGRDRLGSGLQFAGISIGSASIGLVICRDPCWIGLDRTCDCRDPCWIGLGQPAIMGVAFTDFPSERGAGECR